MAAKLYEFLTKLDQHEISYSLNRYRDDAVSVYVVLEDERWEVDFLDNGEVDIERFVSDGEMHDEELFTQLFTTLES